MDWAHVTERFVGFTLLDAREAINIALSVFAFVICGLLGRYVIKEWRKVGLRKLSWPAKLSIGLFLIFAGEVIRSSTIWLLIHFEGQAASYKSGISIMMFALMLMLVGGPCVIRVMTPARMGDKLWVGSLLVVVVLVAINFTI